MRIVEMFKRKNAAADATKKQEKRSMQLECKVDKLVIEKEFLED